MSFYIAIALLGAAFTFFCFYSAFNVNDKHLWLTGFFMFFMGLFSMIGDIYLAIVISEANGAPDNVIVALNIFFNFGIYSMSIAIAMTIMALMYNILKTAIDKRKKERSDECALEGVE